MQITTLMVVILIAWCVVTILAKGFQPVPLPTRVNLKFGSDALGWLKDGGTAKSRDSGSDRAGTSPVGHEWRRESGASEREIEAPKLKN